MLFMIVSWLVLAQARPAAAVATGRTRPLLGRRSRTRWEPQCNLQRQLPAYDSLPSHNPCLGSQRLQGALPYLCVLPVFETIVHTPNAIR